MEEPTVWGKFSTFSVKTYVPFLKDMFPGCAELVSLHCVGEWWQQDCFLRLWDTPPMDSSVLPVCFRNFHHLYQFIDYFIAVVLAMPLKASRLPLAMISRRKCSWTAVWCGTMPLSEHYLLYLFKWYRLIIVSTRWKVSLWAINGRPRLMAWPHCERLMAWPHESTNYSVRLRKFQECYLWRKFYIT